RMPTLSGMRRRGFTPEAIRNFIEETGVTKKEGITEIDLLEYHVRQHLNQIATRRMVVMDPLKIVIENYPDDLVEQMEGVNNPEDESAGTRDVPFSKEIYIEREDFMEDPPKKFFRLAPGVEVRLRYGYFITCTDVIKDDEGNIVELRATYDPETKGGYAPDGRKVKGTLHWVSARHAVPVEVRLYDRLFDKEDPYTAEDGSDDFIANVNPDSLSVTEALAEPSITGVEPGDRFQFERIGYFTVDPDSTDDKLVFNRTITLRDSWKKQQ
ncbi:MAG: glutamine--tRNA ligase, partial [Chloroflexi bacterium]|nr:glutamine--tRNA ligase [Chloroflexota bacterium]